MLDTIAAEYGWPETTIRTMPLAKLFAYYHACAARHGCEPPGPTLVERAMLAAKRAARDKAKS